MRTWDLPPFVVLYSVLMLCRFSERKKRYIIICSSYPCHNYHLSLNRLQRCNQGPSISSPDFMCSCSCTPCAAGTYQTGEGIPFSLNCTWCPADSFQPAVGATNASACIMCPAGRSPAAVNASSCGAAATTSTYSTTLYSVVGAIIGGGVLAAAGTMLAVRRKRHKAKLDSLVKDLAEEHPVEFGEGGVSVHIDGVYKSCHMSIFILTNYIILLSVQLAL